MTRRPTMIMSTCSFLPCRSTCNYKRVLLVVCSCLCLCLSLSSAFVLPYFRSTRTTIHTTGRNSRPLHVQHESTSTKSTSSTTTISNSNRTACAQSSQSSRSLTLNPLVASVKVSKTVEIFSLVKEMQASGMEVTSLCVGEPDFLPPAAVLDAARQAIDDGDTRYTAVTGTAQLRRAIADDLKRRKGVIYNPDTEIVVSNGAKQCVYQGILALIAKGDRVLIPSPYWPSYPEMVTLVGGIPVFIPTHAKDGFLLTPEALEQALSEEENSNNNATTKLLILCNPSNPTGGVHNKKRLQELAAVLEKHPHVAVLADEIYERLVYKKEGEEEEEGDDDASSSCPSFAQFLWDRTLTVNGFSKAYAMTGMRLGYLAAPAYVVKAVTTIQSQLTSCAGSISQAAGVAALLRVSDEELRHNVKVMREKRDYVLGELDSMPGVTVAVPPQGAFYVLPELAESYFDGDDTELCLQLLKRKKLALVPGSSFGAPGTVRISYATSMEELKVAMSKLREFLQEENV